MNTKEKIIKDFLKQDNIKTKTKETMEFKMHLKNVGVKTHNGEQELNLNHLNQKKTKEVNKNNSEEIQLNKPSNSKNKFNIWLFLVIGIIFVIFLLLFVIFTKYIK